MERRTADNLPNPRTREDFLIGTGGTLPSLIDVTAYIEQLAQEMPPPSVKAAARIYR
jgi:hypothetical protein